MILLFGGTSESGPVAMELARRGYPVLVSQTTEIPLAIGEHPLVSLRRGRLPEEEMMALIHEKGIRAIVNVAHPYSAHIRMTTERVAQKLGIPHFALLRPEVLNDFKDLLRAPNHERAAEIAFRFGKPVLLTTGSKNIEPYARASVRTHVSLAVRILDHADSLKACLDAGIPKERIISARGPFTVEENRNLIKKFNAGVLVTKESGTAGGAREKVEAATLEGCRVVVVDRPVKSDGKSCHNISSLIRQISQSLILTALGIVIALSRLVGSSQASHSSDAANLRMSANASFCCQRVSS